MAVLYAVILLLRKEGVIGDFVESKPVFSLRFRAIEGKVGPLEQFLIGDSVLRTKGNAHGAGQAAVRQTVGKQLVDGFHHTGAATGHEFPVGDVAHIYHEFIAADAGDDVLRTEEFANFSGKLGQYGIADQMAMVVVDLLEIIQVDDQQGRLLLGGAVEKFAFHLLLGSILVEQLGKGIPFGLVLKGQSSAFFSVNIDDDTNSLKGFAVDTVLGRGTQTAPQIPPVRFCNTQLHFLIIAVMFQGSHTLQKNRNIIRMEMGGGSHTGTELFRQGLIAKKGLPLVTACDHVGKHVPLEFVTNSIGAQGTVCGGGRYDHLVEEVGGPPIPGVGFGLGIERLIMLMEANGAEFPEEDGLDVFIAVMGDQAKAYGQKLCREFRQKGLSVQMDTLARNIKGQFKYADRLNAKYTVVIGDNEIAEGVVSLKNMAKSEQTQVKFEDLYAEITK